MLFILIIQDRDPKARLFCLSCAKTKPKTHHFTDTSLVRFSWQEFVDNYRTFAADIDSDIKRVRKLLDKLMIDSEFVEP